MLTPTLHPNNSSTDLNKDNYDDATIISSNTSASRQQRAIYEGPMTSPETIYTTSPIDINTTMAIADAVATSHFLLPGAPAKSITPATIPLRIHLPDGSHLMSIHTATLDCDNIPEQARHAHIVPGLHQSPMQCWLQCRLRL